MRCESNYALMSMHVPFNLTLCYPTLRVFLNEYALWSTLCICLLEAIQTFGSNSEFGSQWHLKSKSFLTQNMLNAIVLCRLTLVHDLQIKY